MKLRKLILSGFKSFADRTELEFDDGVSCIVGPNGCGKSNVVDAIKWVLGERSAKSLRGSEMADVIFNGSARRRPAGIAEVTLVFENDRGVLTVPGSETKHETVSVGRRLYRSGVSEYLINKAPSRLKDIREMFMDTGVGVEAYSLIEQGRVEVFLQASQEDRRNVFDEAAGISKYKARKREALRKLDRVEQNVLRLSDVLAEVQKRLRSIKYQAGKARNYQTYSERLKELRALYFLAQYHMLSQRRAELQHRADEASDALAGLTAMIDKLETSRTAAEVESVDLERSARELEGRIAALGAQISAAQERAEMLKGRVGELGDQILAASSRCEELEAKIVDHDRRAQERQSELGGLDARLAELARAHDAALAEHESGGQALAHLRARLEDEKAGTIDLLRRTAQLHNQIEASGVRREGLHGQQKRLRNRADEIAEALRTALEDRAQADAKHRQAAELKAETQRRLDETRAAADELFDTEQALGGWLSESRERRSAVEGRIDTLKELLGRLEGVGEGTRRVLESHRKGELACLRGMLGDFLDTDSRHVPVVEAALAGADQMLLADRFDDVRAAAETIARALENGGAVEILCLDRLGTLSSDFDPACCPQVRGRVIDLVRFPAELAPAAWRMLGRALLVETLDDARDAAKAVPPGWRFITASGEVLEPDGRVRLGSAGKASGVIARRSELTELTAEKERLDERIADLTRRYESTEQEIEHLDSLQQSLRTAVYEASAEQVEAEGALRRLDEQIDRFKTEAPLVAGDLDALSQEIAAAVEAEDVARRQAEQLEARNAERGAEVARLSEQITAAEGRQGELSARMTELKVSLAQVEEKRASVRSTLSAAAQQRRDMAQAVEAGRGEVELARKRRDEAQEGIGKARGEVDARYAELEGLNKDALDIEESRKGLQEKLANIGKRLGEQRKAQQERGEKLNAVRVELGEVDVRIEELISRASDVSGMSLAELYRKYEHDEQRDWDAVEEEIRELRGKIERLGNVNLDAIGEQDELEQRQEFLGKQLDDVRRSEQQLRDLIRRINKESRERFLETFEKVRTSFQELFRKLFGGGRADVLLLDPEDVLESGIEVMARPPGKELRSLSLLSGGEKTMTALALLFSIFKTRPSPFCVLDEVDAALDEANTDRFGRLVREFIEESQFVIITHAKRTMSMANVLYGVTMPEPGVSRRISVRFEDVGRKLDEELDPAGV